MMIRSSKLVRVGSVMIAILGIVGGWIFRQDLFEKNADRRSSEFFEKGDNKTKSSRVRTGGLTQKGSTRSVAGEEIPDELTPAKASLLFEEFKSKHLGIEDRIEFAFEIIKKLCELGYTQEAWDLIEIDQGDIRMNQLAAFYVNAKLSHSELLGKISEKKRNDIQIGFRGFMRRFKPEQFEEILSSSDFKKFLGRVDSLDPIEARVFRYDISGGLYYAFTIPLLYATPDKTNDILKIAARLNSQGLLDATRFMDLAVRFGRRDPFENWGLIRAINSEGVDSHQVEEDRSNMIREMLGIDAPKTLSEILDNENPGKASDINAAVGSWVNLDARGATDWFQQNRATLSPQDRDAIAGAFSTNAGSLSEFSGAQQWAKQIRDPKLKAEVIQKIAEVGAAKAERDRENR